MGILSTSASITRYMVDGSLGNSVIDTVAKGLTKYSVTDIYDDISEKAVGWTSISKPFQPNFKDSSFVIGVYFAFSLRIDKKTIPAKTLNKHYVLEMARRQAESGRKHFSENEKKIIKDHVTNVLSLRIPSTPNVYDIVWNYEKSMLWFFSNLKNANEELETLFLKTFTFNIIRLFPFTVSDLLADLSDSERDVLYKIDHTNFIA